MKNLLRFSTAVLFSISLTACGDGKQEDSAATTTESTTANTDNSTQQGKGSVTLVCNGQTFVTAGNCNYSSPASAIVIADSADNRNAVTLNIEGGLPGASKTYKLVDVVSGTENLSMSFTRFPDKAMNDWETKDGAGTLAMSVEGNKITCTFSNIPMVGSEIYNADGLKGAATCSGSFTLYK